MTPQNMAEKMAAKFSPDGAAEGEYEPRQAAVAFIQTVGACDTADIYSFYTDEESYSGIAAAFGFKDNSHLAVAVEPEAIWIRTGEIQTITKIVKAHALANKYSEISRRTALKTISAAV